MYILYKVLEDGSKEELQIFSSSSFSRTAVDEAVAALDPSVVYSLEFKDDAEWTVLY